MKIEFFKEKAFWGIITVFIMVLFFACNFSPNDPLKDGQTTDGTETEPPKYEYPTGTEPYIPLETENPSPTGSRAADLDFIFNNQTLGKTTIAIKRSEWVQLLKNYDYFYKNENCVHAETYTYEKDGVKWTVPNVGFRLRGNTSRFRPQGKDFPTDLAGNTKPNESWSQDYYQYAAICSDGDYRQSHFKVDFEEWLEDPDEFKMSGCMKGVALKRMDASCTREIMCYDLFHKYGIWTAPRASHTRVFIKFIEDIKSVGSDGSISIIEDFSDCKVTTVDFGVYEMFEEVNKQSLKARDEENNKDVQYKNYWKNNKGNLWKCSGGDLSGAWGFGVENNVITEFDENGNPKAYVWEQPVYDLKTNKDDLTSAETEFRNFITELNALPSASGENSVAKIKAFYEKWFGGEEGVEFFLKTYAVNILVGMDDDYWGNANNYYLYFDSGKKGSGKVYFIPFDYDNTLGCSILEGGFKHNPFDWGRGKNRPLIDKLMLVPEYRQMFKQLLQEVSAEDSHWNFERCSKQFLSWKDMVEPYLNSRDLEGHVSTKWWGDYCWQPSGYPLTSYRNNIYDATRNSILLWTTDIKQITFDLNGGNINGKQNEITIKNPEKAIELSSFVASPKKAGYIFTGWTATNGGNDYQTYAVKEKVYARWKKASEIENLFIYEISETENNSNSGIEIGILNVPHDAAIREIYVNGMQRSSVGFDNNNGVIKVKEPVKAANWVYPYTNAGKTYTIFIEYKNTSWTTIAKTNTITITAKSGEGEFNVTNTPKYEIKNNVLTFAPEPILSKKGGHYVLEIEDRNWNYQSWNWLGDSCDGFDFSKDGVVKNKNADLMFSLYYVVSDKKYGDYKLVLYRYEDTQYFKLN